MKSIEDEIRGVVRDEINRAQRATVVSLVHVLTRALPVLRRIAKGEAVPRIRPQAVHLEQLEPKKRRNSRR